LRSCFSLAGSAILAMTCFNMGMKSTGCGRLCSPLKVVTGRGQAGHQARKLLWPPGYGFHCVGAKLFVIKMPFLCLTQLTTAPHCVFQVVSENGRQANEGLKIVLSQPHERVDREAVWSSNHNLSASPHRSSLDCNSMR
jgi:hypothetical protein